MSTHSTTDRLAARLGKVEIFGHRVSDLAAEASWIDSTDAGWNAVPRLKPFVLDWMRDVAARARRGAEAARRNRFAGNDLVEPLQRLLRLVLHRVPDRGGGLVDLFGEAFGLEDRLGELLHPGGVKRFERLDFEHAFEEPLVALPGLADAELLALFLPAVARAKIDLGLVQEFHGVTLHGFCGAGGAAALGK